MMWTSIEISRNICLHIFQVDYLPARAKHSVVDIFKYINVSYE